MELDKTPLALGIDQCVSVDTKALHHTIRARDCAVRLGPHEHVGSFSVQELEVPEVVVSRLSLGDLVVGLRLAGVYNIGELDCILDEKDRNVVAAIASVTGLQEKENHTYPTMSQLPSSV